MAQPTYNTVALLTDSRVTTSGIERYKIIDNAKAPDIYAAIVGDEYLIPDKLVITTIDGETATTKIGNDTVWSTCTELGGGGGGDLPSGTDRQVVGFDTEGNPTAVTIGIKQLTDIAGFPAFTNGVFVATAINPTTQTALLSFIEFSTATPKAGTFPSYGTGGVLPVTAGTAAGDAVNKGQLDAVTRSPATVAPLAAGTAAVGTSPLYARQDHVHPLQTTVAALTTGRTFTLTGGATGTSAAFTGAANASIPVALATPTGAVRGGILQQAAIADLTAAPTQADFNTLLTALRAAGVIAT